MGKKGGREDHQAMIFLHTVPVYNSKMMMMMLAFGAVKGAIAVYFIRTN